nr:Na+/H+ antiporter NhaC [uncultured Oscillibacter sp.]
MREKNTRSRRRPTFLESMVPIIAMLAILTIGKGVMGYSTEPLLIMVACVAAFVAFRVGVTWDEMLEEISHKIAKGMPAILILISVGALVGTWMASGTIPLMIYYGIQIVNPQWMLVTSFLITAVVSVVTGTSWGSVATMGVALMGISGALGVSLPATAGACIAGSYLGDKMSPLSDTTNLAPIAAGSSLYEHIGHMFYTTIPASIVSLIVYAIAGLQADITADVTSETVTTMLDQLDTMYHWNLLLLLPAVIVLAGSLLRKPTIPVMLLSTAVAGIEGLVIQGVSLKDVLSATVSGFDVSMIQRAGFDPAACSAEITKLLNRGGMNSIMSTTLLVFCAFCFAGIMSRAGCLDVVLEKILGAAKSTGALITATVASCIVMALTTGNSYLSILIPGEMFRDAYKARGLAAKNLSRTLEDAGTVLVPLVPWSAAGAYMTATLGVETLEYLPWAVLCYTGFIFAILWGYTGFGIARLDDGKEREGTV